MTAKKQWYTLIIDAERRELQDELKKLDLLEKRYKNLARPPKLLRLCRKHLGVTQEELALSIGVSRSAILQIERGVYSNDKVYDAAMQHLEGTCR